MRLVNFALDNSKKFKGKIVCAEMRSALMIDVLKVWINKFGGNYKIIGGRKGDRIDEYLIGENELQYTSKIMNKKKNYFIVDFNKKDKNFIKKIISSENSKKLNDTEIFDLLKFGM